MLSFNCSVLIFAFYVQILNVFSNRLVVCTAIAALCLPSLAPIMYHHNRTALRHISRLKTLVPLECKCCQAPTTLLSGSRTYMVH